MSPTLKIKRKNRHQCPIFAKLKLQFDIGKLREDLKFLNKTKTWDGLSKEYNALCETHKKLPQYFLKEEEKPDEKAGYSQLAVSELDESFCISPNNEEESPWARRIAKKNKLADERFYRKPVPGLPKYFSYVLDQFRPFLHRSRLARLKPGGEVKPHIDYDTTYSIRLHIPIESNSKCFNGCFVKGENIALNLPADGGVWFVNQGLKHYALNNGETDRIHLILSVDSQKFISPEYLSKSLEMRC